jgi:hypothetical protein
MHSQKAHLNVGEPQETRSSRFTTNYSTFNFRLLTVTARIVNSAQNLAKHLFFVVFSNFSYHFVFLNYLRATLDHLAVSMFDGNIHEGRMALVKL